MEELKALSELVGIDSVEFKQILEQVREAVSLIPERLKSLGVSRRRLEEIQSALRKA